MRLATGATHARDTCEKAPVFIFAPGLLRKRPLSARRFLSARPISATSFIRGPPCAPRGFISATRKGRLHRAATTVTPISAARVTIVQHSVRTLGASLSCGLTKPRLRDFKLVYLSARARGRSVWRYRRDYFIFVILNRADFSSSLLHHVIRAEAITINVNQ